MHIPPAPNRHPVLSSLHPNDTLSTFPRYIFAILLSYYKYKVELVVADDEHAERKSPNELAKLSIVQLEISRTEAQGHAHGLHMGLNFDMGDEALNRFRMPPVSAERERVGGMLRNDVELPKAKCSARSAVHLSRIVGADEEDFDLQAGQAGNQVPWILSISEFYTTNTLVIFRTLKPAATVWTISHSALDDYPFEVLLSVTEQQRAEANGALVQLLAETLEAWEPHLGKTGQQRTRQEGTLHPQPCLLGRVAGRSLDYTTLPFSLLRVGQPVGSKLQLDVRRALYKADEKPRVKALHAGLD
ncbi:hypothetical protein FIBSPDRAFT_900812 [Athelia psychrophila]|uniref:Uncharacterized protein n=1 Tax=Athelia psychrophila TaxID=1759441 RepID=A0A165XYE1_9AGAM|nr:hypothetical protein FIBSPDRAFT_900812 [Fibularhizoctonia sp. CBS 109695]